MEQLLRRTAQKGFGELPPTTSDGGTTAVVVVDGQDVVHAGIESWVTGSHPRMKIVGHFTSPADFMAVHPVKDPAVDVVLFALSYEGRGPDFDALHRICEVGYRVVVYSYLVDDHIILASLEAGAVSYVAKHESGHDLAEAVYAAHTDTPYVAPRMAKALVNDKRAGRPQLSNREQQVLIAWFQTENKNAVAKKLFIEPSTVATHLQRVRAKYASVGRPAPTKAALVARAIQDGILSVDDL
ncbi:response regulator transcription factor [Mycobacterium sp. MMS18-G62]